MDAVYIAKEDTRIALGAKKDETVSKRLEERLDVGCKSLVRLGVVVHYQRHCPRVRYCSFSNLTQHTSIYRFGANQGPFKDFRQICILGIGYRREIVDKWRIEEREFVLHVSNIGRHSIQGILPEFTHKEPPGTETVVQVLNKALQKFFRVVLDGVEAYTLDRNLAIEPLNPSFHVGFDFWMSVVKIGEPCTN